MKTLLCGGKSCCPSIEENKGKGVIISEGGKKIPFTEKQTEELCEYLYKRKECACKCESCLSHNPT